MLRNCRTVVRGSGMDDLEGNERGPIYTRVLGPDFEKLTPQ